ncbi:MAG TPA: hypothetical protein VMR99_02565 [Candidatus Paceibacterota bacterium]|nr:hypothetical protein [Candidatus Paceibacterota bacterium]
MGYESLERESAEPIQPSFDFGRFQALCFDEEGATTIELTERDGKFYDDDGSVFEQQRPGIYRLKERRPPGYRPLYEKIKAAHPARSERDIEIATNQVLNDRRLAEKRAKGIGPKKKKRGDIDKN